MEVINLLFQESPKVTKILTCACMIISMLTWLEIFSPLMLYFNYDLVFKKMQVERINLDLEAYNQFLLFRELLTIAYIPSDAVVSIA